MKIPFLFCLVLTLSMFPGFGLPVRVLAWDDPVAARDLALFHPKGTQKLEELHPFQRTEAFEVTTGGEKPPAIMAMDKLDPEGVPTSVPIDFSSAGTRALLLLLPDPKNPTGIRPLAIPDDVSNFPWGTIRVVNTTGRELVFTWEKKIAPLPARWTPVDVKPGGATRNMEVKVFLREDPATAIYSAVWEHRAEFRSLIFISASTDRSKGPVEFKFINEDRRVVDLDAETKGGQ